MHDVLTNVSEKTIQCLDHGFVTLVDVMPRMAPEGQTTADYAIVQAARVSYGDGTKSLNEDRGLIRYLMRHAHTTPFEMCLRGDTRIPTMPCKGATRKNKTIKEIAQEFEKSVPSTWVKQLKIRTVDINTGEISATNIKYAKKTGIKKVYKLSTVGPLKRTIYLTDNHPILTPSGYKKLIEIKVGDEVFVNGVDKNFDLKTAWENGEKIEVICDYLKISKSSVYRKLKSEGISTNRRKGFTRKENENLVDPRSRSRKFLKKQCELCLHPATDVHHLDQNPYNNSEDNLFSLCKLCHKAFHNDSFQLKFYKTKIEEISYVGEDEVYDLEVDSLNHNFVAEGFIVHNCEFKFHCKMPIFVARQWIRHRTANVNEYSARYSIVKDEFYLPEVENIRQQSKVNKQGGEVPVEGFVAEAFLSELTGQGQDAYNTYKEFVDQGIAREQSRMILPLNSYTEWYWKIDLHNLFHFLALRCDKHAQWEIRVFAEAMLKLITPIVPIAVEAWEDYHTHRGAVKLTRLEVDAIKHFMESVKCYLPGENIMIPLDTDNQREKSEWEQKAKKLGIF